MEKRRDGSEHNNECSSAFIQHRSNHYFHNVGIPEAKGFNWEKTHIKWITFLADGNQVDPVSRSTENTKVYIQVKGAHLDRKHHLELTALFGEGPDHEICIS